VSRRVVPAGPNTWRCAETGERLELPTGWSLLPPGDAALTRRVKAGGPHWVAQETKGRRTFSRGVLAPTERIERLRSGLERERATPAYRARLAAGRQRRQREQADYVESFRDAVLAFLAFDARYAALASALAAAVTDHTTPVGAGTVGRTRKKPIEERAAAAVIAWLRHQTTGYDDMEIPRVKGRRREVRRRLAKRSRQLLGRFRRGEDVDPAGCPLHLALAASPSPATSTRPAPVQAAPAQAAPVPRTAPARPRPASAAPPRRPLWRTPLQHASRPRPSR
jgi:hypothetical protein